MTLTASTLGQSPEYLAALERSVHESLETRAVRHATDELAAGSALRALAVLEDHVRKEDQ